MMLGGSLRELMRRVDGVLWLKTPGAHHHTRSRCSRNHNSSRGPRRCPRRRRPSGHRRPQNRSRRRRRRRPLRPASTATEYIQRRGQPDGPWRICAVDLAGLWVTSCNVVQSDGPQPRNFENRWSCALFLLVRPTTPCALSTFAQSDSESESESDGVCTRVVRELEIANLMLLLVVRLSR